MSGYEIVNIPCLAYGYSIFCCTPLAHQFLICIPNAWQTFRIRRIGDLGGTCAADCTKTWLCPCCSLIQNEKESKLLLEGRRTGFWGGDGADAGAGAEGVVVQQPSGGLGEEMVMPTAVQDEGITSAAAKLPAIMEGVDERPAVSEAEAKVGHAKDATKAHPHTHGTTNQSPTPKSVASHKSLSTHASAPNMIAVPTGQTTVSEESTPDQAVMTALPQHIYVAPAQEIPPHSPIHLERTKKKKKAKCNSDTTSQRTRCNSERAVPNHLDCFVPYMSFLE